MTDKQKILAVDDEEFNLDNIDYYLTRAGYEVIGAEDGVIALRKLIENQDVDVIVLDRIMPNMDGMEFLKEIKADARFRDIPVVMQTAATNTTEVLEGIQAGVCYYLAKPYENAMLLVIVESALRDVKTKKHLQSEVRKNNRILGLMEESSFRFRTLEEATNLAHYLANCFPNPETVVYGLNELLINAVEHGNLGISYDEKTQLIMANNWENEITRRLSNPENRNKFASIALKTTNENIVVRIRDEGKGFDWMKYLNFSADRVTDPHGRGIATSRLMSFHSMEYHGAGNVVECTVNLPERGLQEETQSH
jgi:DNA-binding response OmpR family regulator